MERNYFHRQEMSGGISDIIKPQGERAQGTNESEKNLCMNSNHDAHQKDTFGQKDVSTLIYTLLKYMKSQTKSKASDKVKDCILMEVRQKIKCSNHLQTQCPMYLNYTS